MLVRGTVKKTKKRYDDYYSDSDYFKHRLLVSNRSFRSDCTPGKTKEQVLEEALLDSCVVLEFDFVPSTILLPFNTLLPPRNTMST